MKTLLSLFLFSQIWSCPITGTSLPLGKPSDFASMSSGDILRRIGSEGANIVVVDREWPQGQYTENQYLTDAEFKKFREIFFEISNPNVVAQTFPRYRVGFPRNDKPTMILCMEVPDAPYRKVIIHERVHVFDLAQEVPWKDGSGNLVSPIDNMIARLKYWRSASDGVAAWNNRFPYTDTFLEGDEKRLNDSRRAAFEVACATLELAHKNIRSEVMARCYTALNFAALGLTRSDAIEDINAIQTYKNQLDKEILTAKHALEFSSESFGKIHSTDQELDRDIPARRIESIKKHINDSVILSSKIGDFITTKFSKQLAGDHDSSSDPACSTNECLLSHKWELTAVRAICNISKASLLSSRSLSSRPVSTDRALYHPSSDSSLAREYTVRNDGLNITVKGIPSAENSDVILWNTTPNLDSWWYAIKSHEKIK